MTFKTEEEARKSWCPMARNAFGVQFANGAVGSGFSANRGLKGEAHGACVASACMAWRWGPAMSVKDGVIHAGDVNGGKRIEVGFCGAFGRPNQAD